MCQAILLLPGLYALLAGHIAIVGNRRVTGTSARIFGLMLIAPAIVGIFLVIFVYPGVLASRDNDALQIVRAIEALALWGFLIAAIIFGVAKAGTAYSAGNAPAVMTLQEAANYLRVSDKDFRAVLDGGRLKVVHIGSQIRVNKADLDEYLRSSSASIYQDLPDNL